VDTEQAELAGRELALTRTGESLANARLLLAEQKTGIKDERATFDAQRRELAEGLEQLAADRAALHRDLAELDAGRERLADELAVLQAENATLADGQRDVASIREALQAARSTLSADRRQLLADRAAFAEEQHSFVRPTTGPLLTEVAGVYIDVEDLPLLDEADLIEVESE